MNILLGILTVTAIGLAVYIGAQLLRSVLMMVPAYTSVLVINALTSKVRACKAGLQFIWPWEKKVENSDAKMEISSNVFECDFETSDEVVISLKIAFDVLPDERHLLEFRRFDSATRLGGIQERIKSILTAEIRKFKGRDAVMDDLQNLAGKVKQCFETAESEDRKLLEEYYGVNLKKLVIADVDLPSALKEASTRKEVAQKDNETRQLEMAKLKQMAKALVLESQQRGSPMPFEKAMEIVQLQFGKGNIQKNVQVFGLDRGTLDVVKTVAEGVLSGKR